MAGLGFAPFKKDALEVDTSAHVVYKTLLTKAARDGLLRDLQNIDADASNAEQYAEARKVAEAMKGKFLNYADEMEIDMCLATLEAIVDRGKKGSKPFEIIAVLEKVLERANEFASAGGRRRRSRRFKPSRRTRRQRRTRNYRRNL